MPSAANGAIEAPRVRWDILDAFREAAEQAGIAKIDDFNCGDNEGSCAYHVTQRRGRRWSSARGFLKPVLHRQNLRLETGCLVERLIVENGRAAGVQFRQDGAVRTAQCRGEVILSAGSIGTPQILMLSGIGPAAHCKRIGIASRARQARRRRQSARPSAAAPDLQGRGREDPERDVPFAARAARHLSRLCACAGAGR